MRKWKKNCSQQGKNILANEDVSTALSQICDPNSKSACSQIVYSNTYFFNYLI